MVKSVFKIFLLLLLFSTGAKAAAFTAKVSEEHLSFGETLVLELNLSDETPQGSPDLSPLSRDFTLLSKKELASTTIINGKTSFTISWQYLITPKTQGKVILPSISIESSGGTLRTAPIPLFIGKGTTSQKPHATAHKETLLAGKASKTNPYKSEPVVYTLRLTTQEKLGNIQLSPLSMEGAVVKPLGKPIVYEKAEEGTLKTIMEVQYSITPLQTGKLIIPSLRIQGERMVPEQNDFDPFMGNALDPFALLQKLGGMGGPGFEKVEPFSLASEKVILDVQPPVPSVNPWLPASSLKISEELRGEETAKVGEPLTRIFTLVGQGVSASQLPSLKDKQGITPQVKIYGDKPTTEESFKKGILTSWREESYTLIPQNAGKLTLPPISIAWWDVKNNRIAHATLPERTLDVAPGVSSPSPQEGPISPSSGSQKAAAPSSFERKAPPPLSPLIYGGVGTLLALVLGLGMWALSLRKKLAHTQKQTEKKEPVFIEAPPFSPLSKTDLSKAQTPAELYLALQHHGKTFWGTPSQASVEVLLKAAQAHNSPLSATEVSELITQLNDALYGGKEGDFIKMREACIKIAAFSLNKKPKGKRKEKSSLPTLNPT